MAAELLLTLMTRFPQMDQLIQPLLDQFESQSRVRVRLQLMTWEEGRPDLNRISFSHKGPDVSEIGSTWLSDLVAMNSLRAFNPLEVNQMGRLEGFLPAAWQSCHRPGDPQIWGIPWTTEVFLIHYRKDLLAQVGLDPQTALASPEGIKETAQRLKEIGLDVPVALPLRLDRFGNLHCLAPFVWHANSQFISEDGKTVLFNQGPALQGINSFYGLLKYCSPEGLRQLDEVGAWELFRSGKTAVAFGSQGMSLNRVGFQAEVVDQVDAVGFKPHSFVGGSNLVIWNHTRYPTAAVELVRFLTSEPIQSKLIAPLNSLPSRLEALNSDAFNQDELKASIVRALLSGRSYPPQPLWGMVEERLSAVLASIWESYYADPTADLETLVRQELNPLARHLSVTFSQYVR